MDNETFEKDEIERLTKALGICRTCGHVKLSHMLARALKKGFCLDVRLANKEQHIRCDCTVFIPKDNLEFLEWAARNKEKGK